MLLEGRIYTINILREIKGHIDWFGLLGFMAYQSLKTILNFRPKQMKKVRNIDKVFF